MLRACVLVVAGVVGAAVTGCGAYQVQGRVVRGPESAVEFVSADDPRLEGPGVSSANVDVIRDPKSLGRETVAALRSDDGGDFVLRINEAGAGWMDEEWRIRCYAAGFGNADRLVRLDSGGDVRLLITLAPGFSVPPVEEEDLWEQYEVHR
jgi:hypothetical protein